MVGLHRIQGQWHLTGIQHPVLTRAETIQQHSTSTLCTDQRLNTARLGPKQQPKMAARPEGAPPARRGGRCVPRDRAAAGRRCRVPQRGVRRRDVGWGERDAGWGERGTGDRIREAGSWPPSLATFPAGRRDWRRHCRSRRSGSAQRWRLAPGGSGGRLVQLRTGRRPALGTGTAGVCRWQRAVLPELGKNPKAFPVFFPAVCNEGAPSGTAGTEPQSPPASWHSRSAVMRPPQPGLEGTLLLQVKRDRFTSSRTTQASGCWQKSSWIVFNRRFLYKLDR